MNEEMRRAILREAKKFGKNKGDVAAHLNKTEQVAQAAARKAEQDAKNLRIQKEVDHFKQLIKDTRFMPSFDVQIAKSFSPLDDAPIPEDDTYTAVIGITPEHAVFGGDPNSYWKRADGNNNVGTWRNSHNIQAITHISIFGSRKGGISEGINLEKTLEISRMVNRFGIGATVHIFDDNGKKQFDSMDEIKASIVNVLSKIYKLPNPLE